ncbi:MAG: hypothetical protein ACR2P2_01270 [Nakamurella sp.]
MTAAFVVDTSAAVPIRTARPLTDFAELLLEVQALGLMRRRYWYYAVKISILLAFLADHQGWWFFPILMLGGVLGVYMGCSFAPNHKGMPLLPESAKVDFLRRQEATLFHSCGIVLRYLNRVGLTSLDPFQCPLVASHRPRG